MAKKKPKIGDLVIIDNTRYGPIGAIENLVNAMNPNSGWNIYVHNGAFLILDLEACPPGYFEKTSRWILALSLRSNTKIFLYTSDLMKYVEDIHEP